MRNAYKKRSSINLKSTVQFNRLKLPNEMRATIFVLFACALAITQASSWGRSKEDSLESHENNDRWTTSLSSSWPRDITSHPEGRLIASKVEKRMERMDNKSQQVKERIVNFVCEQLKTCKDGNSLDERCVMRTIGLAMSFIRNQENGGHNRYQ